MTLHYLQQLDADKIRNCEFPLKKILKDSLYYPACDIDGELIRYCNMHFDRLGICSYVYADYGTGRARLEENLDRFRGYHLIASRDLTPAEVGADKPLRIPKGIDLEEYRQYQNSWQPFAKWAVYKRDAEYGEEHGPKRFSLLFLGAEGVAAYSGLYLANGIVPKAMAIIQPGHAFGLNWTNFTDPSAPLTRTLLMGRSLPEYIFYGGLGYYEYNNLPWPGYQQIDRVDHYYPKDFESTLTVWQGTVKQ